MKKSALQVFALVFLSLCPVVLLELQIVYASPYIDIDVDMAYNMIKNSSIASIINLVVLDVRSQSEYDSGHIFGAVLIPHIELEARIDELTGHEDHEIIVYCGTGGRSVIASEILDSYNFTKVYNMLGGIQAWQSAGYPITNPMETKATFWTLLIPEFKLGLWNAWILTLSFLLYYVALFVLVRLRGQKGPSRPSTPSLNETEKKLDRIALLIVLASVFYSFFLPLKLGTAWLYIGLIVYLFGIIFNIVAATNLMNTPLDRPATKGLYRISRNPRYLGGFLILIGIGIACASWLFLLLIVVFIILQHILVGAEERWCLEKYGDAYREYMDRTPKWVGLPKSKKK